jgi:hypothetical protein
MKDLVDAIDELLRYIQPAAHGESIEASLRDLLTSFREGAVAATKPRDVMNSANALARFCTEHMNWDSGLYRRCIALVEKVRTPQRGA